MFGFFKKKVQDKDSVKGSNTSESNDWGMPVPAGRKMSKSEMEKEAAEQAMIEQKNRERREVYRPAGVERIVLDLHARRLALRTELNLERPTQEHPPITTMVFWGAKEVGHIYATVENGLVLVTHCKTEASFAERGISAELLQELERVARENGWQEVRCPSPNGSLDWSDNIYAQMGYSANGVQMTKALS